MIMLMFMLVCTVQISKQQKVHSEMKKLREKQVQKNTSVISKLRQEQPSTLNSVGNLFGDELVRSEIRHEKRSDKASTSHTSVIYFLHPRHFKLLF